MLNLLRLRRDSQRDIHTSYIRPEFSYTYIHTLYSQKLAPTPESSCCGPYAAGQHESGVSIGLHAWSITSITSINPRAADSVKNILQYRHINGGIVQTRTTEAGVRGGTPTPDGSRRCVGTI